jgi:hypothetical protein
MRQARIELPNAAAALEFRLAVQHRHPMLTHVWGSVDGLKLSLADPGDSTVQNAYYNGWAGGCYVGNLFVFSADGCIAYRVLNAPGSWHDSEVATAGGLYSALDKVWDEHGVTVVADAAFPRGRVNLVCGATFTVSLF